MANRCHTTTGSFLSQGIWPTPPANLAAKTPSTALQSPSMRSSSWARQLQSLASSPIHWTVSPIPSIFSPQFSKVLLAPRKGGKGFGFFKASSNSSASGKRRQGPLTSSPGSPTPLPTTPTHLQAVPASSPTTTGALAASPDPFQSHPVVNLAPLSSAASSHFRVVQDPPQVIPACRPLTPTSMPIQSERPVKRSRRLAIQAVIPAPSTPETAVVASDPHDDIYADP